MNRAAEQAAADLLAADLLAGRIVSIKVNHEKESAEKWGGDSGGRIGAADYNAASALIVDITNLHQAALCYYSVGGLVIIAARNGRRLAR